MKTIVNATVKVYKVSDPNTIIEMGTQLTIPGGTLSVKKEDVIKAAKKHFGALFHSLISYEIVE